MLDMGALVGPRWCWKMILEHLDIYNVAFHEMFKSVQLGHQNHDPR
jgi:hypothetical protein